MKKITVVFAFLFMAVASVYAQWCVSAPSGLVSWWPGEGNATDIIGSNNGVLMNGTGFTNGEVGMAFDLNGINNYVLINPASSNLDVGQSEGFTIEDWINLATLSQRLPVVEYERVLGSGSGTDIGVQIYVNQPTGSGNVFANIVDTDGNSHLFTSADNLLVTGVWQHIALTYSKATGQATIYLNGTVVAQQNFGSFTPQTGFTNLLLGARTYLGSSTSPADAFSGAIDEMSFYNRALTTEEIAAIYNAGSAGKCAPVVTTTCTPPPAGIVGWWKGDGTAVDVVGGNNGVLVNVSYTNGVDGQAFAFDPENYPTGTYTGVQIADRPAYALTNALTIEGWIRPRGDGYAIFFRGDNRPGLDPYDLSMEGNHFLEIAISDEAGNGDLVGTTVAYGQWMHVAATWDSGSGLLSLYTNGMVAAQKVTTVRPFGELIAGDAPGIGIGNNNDGNNFPFFGDIDEIALYNRALTPVEIQAIYNAGSAGKCLTPTLPLITMQPQSQTNSVGGSAIFSVTASGTAPLNYQWILGTASLAGATNATLMLTNLQLIQGGNYSVLVSNIAGSTNSTVATLTVSSPTSCDPPPSGIVGWWPANGDGTDIIGGNNAVLVNGTTFTAGEVGGAFNLNGANNYVLINPASANLDVGQSDGFTIEGWINPATLSQRLPVVEYERMLGSGDGADTGVQIYVNQPTGAGDIFVNIVDTSFNSHLFTSANNVLATGVWQHIALTYSKATGLATIYLNGAMVAQQNFGSFTPQTSFTNLLLGARTYLGSATSPADAFAGGIDEMSFYGRAISSNEVAAIYNAGSAGKCNIPVVPPVITQQPQSQTVVSFNNASFTVAATGAGPLSYQWRKGGTNLVEGGNVSGSTTTNLVLASVRVSDAGNYDVVVSTPYATTISAVAVLSVPQTGMTLGSANAMSGTSVAVPVLMNSLGVENTFLATVGYDPTKLVLQSVQLGSATAGAYVQEVDTETNAGLVGFAILLNGGSTVPAGTNEQVALLNFQALPVTSNTTVGLFFTNNPTLQQTYDNNINLLPTIYVGGTVTLLPAEYEADVYPRTNSVGDHQVTVQDWLEEGRMVAGLDTPMSSDEMLRADCAPRNAPDGVLTVADWVQAGRYALGLDPLTLVSLPPVSNLKFQPLGGPAPTRTLQVGNVAAQRGQTVSVPVQLVCTTNENAVGLTISFDSNQLKVAGVTLGSAMTGGRTNINYSQPGKLGLVVGLSPGASLAAGTNQLLVLQITTGTNASGLAALTLDSSVAQLQVADRSANVLAANYVSGAVILPAQPVLTSAVAGANLQLTWPISTGTFQVQSANSPAGPWTNAPLSITTNGASATVIVTATNQQQYFRLVGK